MRSYSFLRFFIKIGLLSLSLLLPASTWGMLPSGHQNEGGWGITTTIAAALARTGWDTFRHAINRAHALLFGNRVTPQPADIVPQPEIITINPGEDALLADEIIITPIPAQDPLELARAAAQAKLDEEARLKAEAQKQRRLEAEAQKRALAAKKAEEARQKALAEKKIKAEAQEREKQRRNRLMAIFIGTQPVGTTRQVGLADGETFFGMPFDTFLIEYADFLNEALDELTAAGENLDPEAARNARREAAGIIRNALKNQLETRKAEVAQAFAEEEAIRQTQIQAQFIEAIATQRELQLQRLLLPEDVNLDQPGIDRADFQRIEGHLFLEREDGSLELVPNVLAPRLLINRVLIVRFYAEAEAIASHLPSNYSPETFLANIRDFIRTLAVNLNENHKKFSLFKDNWLLERQSIAYQAALGLKKTTRLKSFGENFANTLWTVETLQNYLQTYFKPAIFEKLTKIISHQGTHADFKFESEEVFSPQKAISINSFPFAVSALRGVYLHLSVNDQTALLKWLKGRGQATYAHLHSLEEVVSLQQQFLNNLDLFSFYLTPEGNLNSDHFFNLFQAFDSMIKEACLCPIYAPKAYTNNNHACLCAEDPRSCLQADRFALAMMVAGIALEANAACNQFTAEEWAQALASAQKGEPILNSPEALSVFSDEQIALINSGCITKAQLHTSIKIEGDRDAHRQNLRNPRAMHALAAAAAQFLTHFPNEWLTYGNLRIVRDYSNNNGPLIQIVQLDDDEANNVPESAIVINTIIQEGTIYHDLAARLDQRATVDPTYPYDSSSSFSYDQIQDDDE